MAMGGEIFPTSSHMSHIHMAAWDDLDLPPELVARILAMRGASMQMDAMWRTLCLTCLSFIGTHCYQGHTRHQPPGGSTEGEAAHTQAATGLNQRAERETDATQRRQRRQHGEGERRCGSSLR
eukprot:scaffold18613_cov112-Isochrysis_galbana.AAC.3